MTIDERVRVAADELQKAIVAARDAGYRVDASFAPEALAQIAVSETADVKVAVIEQPVSRARKGAVSE